jgi:hypothetical protein
MCNSPFNVVSKNGINLPDEIESYIGEMSVLLRKKMKQTLDSLIVEIRMGTDGMFERAYPKTKAQQLLDSFYWYYSSEELALGISSFYKENYDSSNTMKKYIDICWSAGTPFVKIKFQPHNLINMLDYQTLITLRQFMNETIASS